MTRDPAGPLGCKDSRAASSERVQNYSVATAAVTEQIGHQTDGLRGWVQFEVAAAGRVEAVDAWII
jgi:hypothetical protein